MAMSEDEYMQGENSDDEVMYEYLIDEPDDLFLVMLPKLDFNIADYAETYYKMFKKCRNKDQIIQLLNDFGAGVAQMSYLKSEIQYLQDRSKELEYNVRMFQNQ